MILIRKAGFGIWLLLASATWGSLMVESGGCLLASDRPATMQAVLDEGISRFAQGDYGVAAEMFSRLESEFGREPQYATMTRVLLPVWAYAELQREGASLAVTLLERFVKTFPDERGRLGFVFYTLAQAYQKVGETRKAIDTYQRFIELSPNSAEAAWCVMRQAELYFEMGDDDAGITRLVSFSENSAISVTLQTQARLRAIQQAQSVGNDQIAADLLLGWGWNVQTMPELAVLAFAALRAGEHLMGGERFHEAIRMYRLVPPMEQLIMVQRQKLEDLEFAYQLSRREKGNKGLRVRDEYYRSLIGQVRGQLESLEKSDDYTSGMQLRLGQAFLVADRYREAMVLYADLAEDEGLPDDIRSQAHYGWILTTNAVEDWDSSLIIARSYLDRYPQNSLAPQVLYLIAGACEGKGRYGDAVEVLGALLETYPSHELWSRWLFVRGYNYTMANCHVEAREDFRRYLNDHPDGSLVHDVRYWYALSCFFDRKYEVALTAFDEARSHLGAHHRLMPEVDYRRANTLYSMRRYGEALESIECYLRDYPGHGREAEARVLRGDILMGQGRLVEASTAFARVTPEAGALYPYAVFQRGKIMKALEAYDLMIEHFDRYVGSEDVPEKVRIAEALYWIGWAYAQKGERTKAFPIFMEALERYGNDRQAGEVENILRALQRLHQEHRRGEMGDVLLPGNRADIMLKAERFEDFLLHEKDGALSERRLTYYARIQQYLAHEERRRKRMELAEAHLWEIVEHVPVEDMDAVVLAEVGLLMQEAGLMSARIYLEHLLLHFAGSASRGSAFYGLARVAWEEKDGAVALDYLERFSAETPTHNMAPEVNLLRGEVLTYMGEYERAVNLLSEMLRVREYKGRYHAKALLGIARAYEGSKDKKKAIAYYQRIYTAYRAYPELLEPAYLRSAVLFEELGDVRSAYNTYREMLLDERLRGSVGYEEARSGTERLALLLPGEVGDASVVDENVKLSVNGI